MASLVVFYILTLCHLLGLTFFFFGFLPTKPIINSKNDHDPKKTRDVWQWKKAQHQEEKVLFPEEQEQSLKKQTGSMVMQPFSKLVIMIIDALREDFVFESKKMPFTLNLLRSNQTFRYMQPGCIPCKTYAEGMPSPKLSYARYFQGERSC